MKKKHIEHSVLAKNYVPSRYCVPKRQVRLTLNDQ